MSKEEIFYCDSCGIKLPQQQTISVWIDRKLDAAGSLDNEYEYFDLCFHCLQVVTEKLLKKIPDDERQAIMRIWSKSKGLV